jgi:outer membrane lipoprotein SlyB
MSREKALQAVVAGQQAENLLDFDADDSAPTPTPGLGGAASLGGLEGLNLGGGGAGSTAAAAAGQRGQGTISSQQIASAAKSTNPLDELMDLFSSASVAAPQQKAGQSAMAAGLEDLMSPQSTGQQGQGKKQAGGDNDDLLGLF